MTLNIARQHRDDVEQFLLSIADDEYLTGHQLGMWLAVSPTLEADNALTSIAQDELGHARLWYDIVSENRTETTDSLAIERPPEKRRNTILVEREYTDFADAIVRNYLYDCGERLLLKAIHDGDVNTLVDSAGVALNEEPFHSEHAKKWLDVLDATEESVDRLEKAFRTNLEAASDLFLFPESMQSALLEENVLAELPEELARQWETKVTKTVSELPVDIGSEEVFEAVNNQPALNGREGEHTHDLEELYESMQPAEIDSL
jgi:ring-1,2-phenylacetyl-CoA epoxidase subunit PaaC